MELRPRPLHRVPSHARTTRQERDGSSTRREDRALEERGYCEACDGEIPRDREVLRE